MEDALFAIAGLVIGRHVMVDARVKENAIEVVRLRCMTGKGTDDRVMVVGIWRGTWTKNLTERLE